MACLSVKDTSQVNAFIVLYESILVVRAVWTGSCVLWRSHTITTLTILCIVCCVVADLLQWVLADFLQEMGCPIVRVLSRSHCTCGRVHTSFNYCIIHCGVYVYTCYIPCTCAADPPLFIPPCYLLYISDEGMIEEEGVWSGRKRMEHSFLHNEG